MELVALEFLAVAYSRLPPRAMTRLRWSNPRPAPQAVHARLVVPVALGLVRARRIDPAELEQLVALAPVQIVPGPERIALVLRLVPERLEAEPVGRARPE